MYKLRGQLHSCFGKSYVKWTVKTLKELTLISILIYGNVIFYSKDAKSCKKKDPQGYWLMQFILILGYFYFLLVFIMLLIVFLSIGLTIQNRLQRRRNKYKYRKILKKLKKIRYSPFTPELNQECSICWNDFEETDEIIVMTCDERHQFHSACIE